MLPDTVSDFHTFQRSTNHYHLFYLQFAQLCTFSSSIFYFFSREKTQSQRKASSQISCSVGFFPFCFWYVFLISLSRLSVSAHFPSLSFRVQVEFYVNENTFKERLKLFFIKNQRSSEFVFIWDDAPPLSVQFGEISSAFCFPTSSFFCWGISFWCVMCCCCCSVFHH